MAFGTEQATLNPARPWFRKIRYIEIKKAYKKLLHDPGNDAVLDVDQVGVEDFFALGQGDNLVTGEVVHPVVIIR